MEFVSGTSVELPADLMTEVARYRHRVFVEQLGWRLPTTLEGLELDQFDREDTVYVVARNELNNIVGTARLLPTTRPYLLGEVFPHLLHGQAVPCSPRVWELSRFAAVDVSGANAKPHEHISASILNLLLREAMRTAAGFGAERLIMVTWLSVERLLRKLGVQAHRAAPPVVMDGQPLLACWIDLPVTAPQVTH